MDLIEIHINTWDEFKEKHAKINNGSDTVKPIRGRKIDDEAREAFIFVDQLIYICRIYGNTSGQIDEFDEMVDNDSIEFLSTRMEMVKDVSPMFEATHNYNDRTTWWFGSGMISGGVLSGSGTVWNILHNYIIDMEHGKFLGEDELAGAQDSLKYVTPQLHQEDDRVKARWPNGNFLLPKLEDASGNIYVRVDENPSSGEYVIDYESGVITTGNDATGIGLKFSYHFSQGSEYEFWVKDGKALAVHTSEVNTMNTDPDSGKIYFDVVLDHPLLGNGIVYKRRSYKSLKDIIDASTGTPIEWLDWEGNKWIIYPWPYPKAASTNEDARLFLHSASNMKIRLSMKDDKPYSTIPGHSKGITTITIYAISMSE